MDEATKHGAPTVSTQGGHGPRIQAEAWTVGGTTRMLAVRQDGPAACAWLVRHEADGDAWSGGVLRLKAAEGPHDREAVFEAAELAPLVAEDMVGLGFLDGRSVSNSLAVRIARYDAQEEPQTSAGRGFAKPSGRDGIVVHVMRSPAAERNAPGVHGYPEPVRGILSKAPFRMATIDPGYASETGGVERLRRCPETDLVSEVERILAPGLAILSDLFRRGRPVVLGPATWTPAAHGFFGQGGRSGERRRQAGRLYPAFAPILAGDAAIAEAIDAGRPYEDRLRVRVAEILHGPGSARNPAVDAARLRRMRTIPSGMGFETLGPVVDAATRLPVDWLPGDGRGWDAFSDAVPAILRVSDRLGLDLADLLSRSHSDWTRLTGRGPGPNAVHLACARDVAARFRDSLTGPLLRTRGHAAEEDAGLRVACAILFGGRSLQAIDRIQARWHAGLGALEAGLPAGAATNAWPAAFAPFEPLPGGGYRIVCLVDEGQLKDEGAQGPDRDGVEGLDHCVGGYGVECFSGETHVASVRRRTSAGWERLSTVAFEAVPSGDGNRALTLAVVQHLGRGNAEPDPAAGKAVDELMAAIGLGRHAVDQAALAPRSGDGFEAGYDPHAPGALERAFAAWAPYLPRGVVREGLPGLAERAMRLSGESLDLPPADDEDVVVVDLEASGLGDGWGVHGAPTR